MVGEVLLYLMVTDLRELGDDDIREVLELLVGCTDELLPVQEEALEQLQAEALDRDLIQELPDEYAESLPERMEGYEEALQEFDEVLEEALEDESLEDNDRVERFRACLELLDEESDWQQRSEAARGVGTLEEELFLLRSDYLSQPLRLEDCCPDSVIAHRMLLEGFECWQEAIRLMHQGELEEALETAVEACGLFLAVERWAQVEETGEVVRT